MRVAFSFPDRWRNHQRTCKLRGEMTNLLNEGRIREIRESAVVGILARGNGGFDQGDGSENNENMLTY